MCLSSVNGAGELDKGAARERKMKRDKNIYVNKYLAF
jgi:hypothetical protein